MTDKLRYLCVFLVVSFEVSRYFCQDISIVIFICIEKQRKTDIVSVNTRMILRFLKNPL